MLFQSKDESFRKQKRRAKRLSNVFVLTDKWEIQVINESAESVLV